MEEILLSARNIKKYFPIRRRTLSISSKEIVHAVNGVDFSLNKGETLGLVGESGCGKSTLGRVILRLIEPTSGEIFFQKRDIRRLKGRELRDLRRDMQIIYQDPYGSLNPRIKVANILAEPLRIHDISTGSVTTDRVADLLRKVGMSPASMAHYPHEFSGGQRQRICIARALATNPKLIVCDEPVSALDVSIQAQVINLLKSLQNEFDLSYLFIAHDLMVVEYISDRVAIMYLGKIIEIGDNKEIYNNPKHPYTEALLSAVPIPSVHVKRNRIILEGEVPSPVNLPSGCLFHNRCPHAKKECSQVEPPLKKVSKGHFVACHLQ
jgi:oligopeptide transport system ATP-binding protein